MKKGIGTSLVMKGLLNCGPRVCTSKAEVMVNGLHFIALFDPVATQSASQYCPLQYSPIQPCKAAASSSGAIGLRCPAQGHLSTRVGDAGVRTSNLLVTSQPALPPEHMPPQCRDKGVKCRYIFFSLFFCLPPLEPVQVLPRREVRRRESDPGPPPGGSLSGKQQPGHGQHVHRAGGAG